MELPARVGKGAMLTSSGFGNCVPACKVLGRGRGNGTELVLITGLAAAGGRGGAASGAVNCGFVRGSGIRDPFTAKAGEETNPAKLTAMRKCTIRRAFAFQGNDSARYCPRGRVTSTGPAE